MKVLYSIANYLGSFFYRDKSKQAQPPAVEQQGDLDSRQEQDALSTEEFDRITAELEAHIAQQQQANAELAKKLDEELAEAQALGERVQAALSRPLRFTSSPDDAEIERELAQLMRDTELSTARTSV